ncbi:MAG: hypothetical protein RLZZ600_1267 [Actinomycetota bacterium]|jgi:hypothetical protein
MSRTTKNSEWIERPRDRELSIGLLLLGALITVVCYFFAFIFAMGYRNAPIQDWSIIFMGFGPPVVYLVSMIVAIRWIRRRKRSWPAALAACVAPVLTWFLGLGTLIVATTILAG